MLLTILIMLILIQYLGILLYLCVDVYFNNEISGRIFKSKRQIVVNLIPFYQFYYVINRMCRNIGMYLENLPNK